MNLYYAMGGGLGHLTRASAFLHQFNLNTNTAILTHSKYAKDKRIVSDIEIIEVNKTIAESDKLYLQFLKSVFANRSFETIYLDTFPFGIKGEFAHFDFGNAKTNYIARLLNWERYLQFTPTAKTRFHKTFVLEKLDENHNQFIQQKSDRLQSITLKYPEPKFTSKDHKLIEKIKQKKDFWLVVHSFPENEVSDLVSIADEQRKIEKSDVEIVIITPLDYSPNISNCTTYNIFPASVLFLFAKRIFTACGFNIMQQTKDFRHKHQFIPYKRKFDKQHLRAERFRKTFIKQLDRSFNSKLAH